MLERGKLDRGIMEMVDLEGLVPSEHLLRKIDAAVDFHELYEIVEALYSEDQGRPSVANVIKLSQLQVKKHETEAVFAPCRCENSLCSETGIATAQIIKSA